MAAQQSQDAQARNEQPGDARAPDTKAPEAAMPGGRQPGAQAGEPTDQGLYRQPEGYLQPPLPPAAGGAHSAVWQPGLAQQHRGVGHMGHYADQDWGSSEYRHPYGQADFGRAPGGAFYAGPYGRPAGARKGPKDFVRTDERLREAVCERLFDQEWIDVSDVSVQVTDGCVLLEGTVAERRMKHAIEDIADSCLGVRDVDNRIRVRRFGEAAPEPGPQGDPQV